MAPEPTSAGSSRSLLHRAGWLLCWSTTRLAAALFFRLRVRRTGPLPPPGPMLIVANHQSYIDPPLISFALGPRMIEFLARAGLFKPWWLRTLITFLNSHPVQEDGNDLRAIRKVLELLAQGRAVVVFPEGSRTFDGSVTPFKRGVAVLLKRAGCPVLPVAIEGAFDAWPRTRKKPSPKPVAVMVGQPITSADLLKDGPDAALARLTATIDQMRLELRAELRRKSRGKYPPPGPGDAPVNLPATQPQA